MCGFGGNGGRGHHRGWDGGRGQSRKRLHQHLQPVTPRGAKRHRPFAEAGVAAIEFALIAPIFLILMFGIVVYGFYFGTCIALAHAASEGARASIRSEEHTSELQSLMRISYAVFCLKKT